MSEMIKTQVTDEFVDMQTRIAALDQQLRVAREETMLKKCIANKDGIIKGLAYSIRCNGVSGSEMGGIEGRMKKKIFGALWVIAFVLLFALLVSNLTGCEYVPEAQRVSHNISRQADNFNVVRRLTVINTRSDKVVLQMTGKISIEDVTDGIAVLVELDRDKSIYQKHYVYLNENTMYTVEDVTGVSVSRYAYEMEFMPQALIPVRITADELLEDADAYGRRLDDIDDENEEPESGGD